MRFRKEKNKINEEKNDFEVPFFWVTLAEEEKHILDNGPDEDAFLTAVEKGDVNTFMDLLDRKDKVWLNMECKDANGMSALRIAISQGYSASTNNVKEHILDNGPDDDDAFLAFLAAVEKGDVNTFMDLLDRKDKVWLNMECKDANGMSALRIAISQGYSVIVEKLLLQGVYIGDALLRAVDIGLQDTVKIICQFAESRPTKEERNEIMECHCDNDDYHRYITPIVLAGQRNDFTNVKILLDYGLRIPEPVTKQLDKQSTGKVDDLLKSVGTLELYKALSSEAYVSQAYRDAVDRSFELGEILEKLSRTDIEFKESYLKLVTNVDEIGRDIISHARNTEEIMTVLTQKDKKTMKDSTDAEDNGAGLESRHNMSPLPKLSRAIAFNQKHFVAHPNCQQAILAKFYGRLAYLRDRSPMHRRLIFLAIVFCFPFISLAYLYVPTVWIKNNIGCQYTKFMLQMASDLLFVCLLAIDTYLNEGVSTMFTLHRPTKVLLLLWIIGIAWREIKAYRRRGIIIFTQTKHLRDSGLAFLFLIGIVFDIAHYQYELNYPLQLNSTNGSDLLNYTNGTDINGIDPSLIERQRRAILENSMSINDLETPMNSEESIVTFDLSKSDTIILNRIPIIPIAKAGKGGRPTNVKLSVIDGADGLNEILPKITDPVFLRFYDHAWYHPRLVSTALFAMSTVVSFLRMLPYVVVSDVIGPLQISLGKMINGTVHFFLVVGVIVFSFSVGLTYIYAYYDEIKYRECVKATDGDNKNICPNGKLSNLFFGVMFLYWSVFGVESMEPLQLRNQAFVMQAAGVVLYGMFYIFVVVVLLNALIAVMSNVYNEVEENGDMEWKFASTELWMDVLIDDDVVAPPFNLFPSREVLIRLWQRVSQKCRRKKVKNVLNHNGCIYTKKNKRDGKLRKNDKGKRDYQNSQYQRVMGRLVERYVGAKTADEVSVEADVGMADIRALRNDLLSLKFEMYQKLCETNDDIHGTIRYGSSVLDKCKETDGLFSYTEEVRGNVLHHIDYLVHYNCELQGTIDGIPPSRPPTPPPPPPEMIPVYMQTDPIPPPPPPNAPPLPKLRTFHTTQTTPPATPATPPEYEDWFTQVTPPPTPPGMVDQSTEMDAAIVPQSVGSMVSRWEIPKPKKSANLPTQKSFGSQNSLGYGSQNSLVSQNSLGSQNNIGPQSTQNNQFGSPFDTRKDPWRPLGKPKGGPPSPGNKPSGGQRSTNSRSPRISPDLQTRSTGPSPEANRKKLASSRSNSTSSGAGSLSSTSSKRSSPVGSIDETIPTISVDKSSGNKPNPSRPTSLTKSSNPNKGSSISKKAKPVAPSHPPKAPSTSGKL